MDPFALLGKGSGLIGNALEASVSPENSKSSTRASKKSAQEVHVAKNDTAPVRARNKDQFTPSRASPEIRTETALKSGSLLEPSRLNISDVDDSQPDQISDTPEPELDTKSAPPMIGAPSSRKQPRGERPPSPPPPPKREARLIPDQRHLKYALAHGFHYKQQLPIDMVKLIIGQCDLLVTMLFAMTCKSFQQKVAWESIKHIDLDLNLPFAQEDLPALCRSLERRKEKLISVESIFYEQHKVIEEVPSILNAVSSHLKVLHISPSWLSLDQAVHEALTNSAHILEDVKLSAKVVDFASYPANRFPRLAQVDVNIPFADVPKLLLCCPNLENVTSRLEDSFDQLPNEWSSTFQQLRSLRNFRSIRLVCSDLGIWCLMGNKSAISFNSFVLDHVETNVGIENMPLIRVGSGKFISDWIRAREFQEPSQNEYWKIDQWCRPNESVEDRSVRTLELVNSLIVPKRRMQGRRSLGIYLDKMVTSSITRYFGDIDVIIKLVTALDLSLLHDRAKFWFDELGRRAFEAARAQGKALKDFCRGENIEWAGFIAQALKDPAWCRQSGFLQDLLYILQKKDRIRNYHYNIRPGLFALMMEYDEIMNYFYDACSRNYSNWHSGMIGRMIAEYGIATDIPPMSVHIEKIAKIMRTMVQVGRSPTPGGSPAYWARLPDLATEDHRWDLELLSYTDGEGPIFQECRLMLMELCERGLNYLSQRNAGTWLDASDDVPMKHLRDLIEESTKWYPYHSQERERFENNIWCAVFNLVEQGREPARIVKRAMEFGPLPKSLSNPVGYTRSNYINLESLANGGSTPNFSVWSSDVVAKVQIGLYANISK